MPSPPESVAAARLAASAYCLAVDQERGLILDVGRTRERLARHRRETKAALDDFLDGLVLLESLDLHEAAHEIARQVHRTNEAARFEQAVEAMSS